MSVQSTSLSAKLYGGWLTFQHQTGSDIPDVLLRSIHYLHLVGPFVRYTRLDLNLLHLFLDSQCLLYTFSRCGLDNERQPTLGVPLGAGGEFGVYVSHIRRCLFFRFIFLPFFSFSFLLCFGADGGREFLNLYGGTKNIYQHTARKHECLLV